MSSERKPPVCSHCLQNGHTKASPKCPLKGQEPAPRPEPEAAVNRWTPEKEGMLLRLINEGPLKPDWDKISEAIDHTPASCKSKYYELKSPEENLRDLSLKVSSVDILTELCERRTQCATCSTVLFIPLFEWRGISECPTCYSAHDLEQNLLWKGIEPFARCLFCNRGRCDGIPLHFDHLNMFEKDDSICSMVRRGDPLDNIIREVSKCQVLCKSCHAVITSLENIVGFRRAKVNLTRSINGTSKDGESISPEMATELQMRYRDLYKNTIEPLYPMIKRLITPVPAAPQDTP